MTRPLLVVEDEPELQETLRLILELEGYDTAVACDGIEALRQVETLDPHVILLDLMMPRMDGFGFVRELERLGKRADKAVVILTADGRAKQKAARIGADRYLAKPFEIDDLLAIVEDLLRDAAAT